MPDGKQPWWRYLFALGPDGRVPDRRRRRQLLEAGPEIPPSPEPLDIIRQGKVIGQVYDLQLQAAELKRQQLVRQTVGRRPGFQPDVAIQMAQQLRESGLPPLEPGLGAPGLAGVVGQTRPLGLTGARQLAEAEEPQALFEQELLQRQGLRSPVERFGQQYGGLAFTGLGAVGGGLVGGLAGGPPGALFGALKGAALAGVTPGGPLENLPAGLVAPAVAPTARAFGQEAPERFQDLGFTPEQLRQMAPWEQVLMASIGTPLSGVFPSLQQARAAFTPGAALPIRRTIGTALTKVPLPGAGEAALKVSGIPQVKGAAERANYAIDDVIRAVQKQVNEATNPLDKSFLRQQLTDLQRAKRAGRSRVPEEYFVNKRTQEVELPPGLARVAAAAAPEAAAPITVRAYRAETGVPGLRSSKSYALNEAMAVPETPVGAKAPPFKVVAQDVTLQNPLRIKGLQGDLLDQWAKTGDQEAARILAAADKAGAPPPGWYREADTYIAKKAGSLGYDGVFYDAGRRGEIAVFEPGLVKPAPGAAVTPRTRPRVTRPAGPVTEPGPPAAGQVEGIRQPQIQPAEAITQQPAREIPKVTPPSEAVTPPVEPSAAQPPVQPPGGRKPTAEMPASQPPQVTGNTYVASLRPLDDVAKKVVIRDDILGRIAAKTGINPSVLRDHEFGPTLTAYERQQIAIDNLADTAVAAALDTHAQAFTGRLGGVLPIDSKGFVRGTGKLWQDVFSAPDAYATSAKGTPLRAYIDDFNQLIAEAEAMRVQAGLEPLSRILPEGKFYVPRQTKTIRGVELERPSSPKLQRYYEEATEGYGRGVRYDTDPRATAQLHLRVAYREVLEDQLSTAMAAAGVKPSALVPAAIRDKAAQAARAFAQAKLNRQRLVVPRAQEALAPAEAKAMRAQARTAVPQAEAALAEARRNFFAAKAQYRRAMDAARRAEVAPGNLFGQAPETIGIGLWRNRYFPREQADMLNEAVGFLTRRREGSPFVKGLATVGNTIRYLASVGDLAEPFIQGLPMLTRDPVLWSKAALRHYQAFFDPVVQARFIKDHLREIQQMAQYGVPIGDVEFFAALKPGQGISFEQLFKRLPKGREIQELMRLGGRQSFGRFQNAYNMGLTTERAFLWRSLERGIPDLAERAAYIRNVTGGLESKALGVGPMQRAAEGMWLGFSPKLLRSTVALLGDALRPTTPRGREALRTLGQLVAGATGIYVLTGLALGRDWDEIKAGLNPLNGKKFLSYRIGNEWIGVGGQVRAITQLVARVSMALLPGGEKPEAIVSGGLFDNPLIQFYYFRGAPALGITGKVAEFALGKDVIPFEKIDSLPDLFLSLFTSAAPFALQGHLEGENALGTAFGFFGFRTSPATKAERGEAGGAPSLKLPSPIKRPISPLQQPKLQIRQPTQGVPRRSRPSLR